MAQKTPRGFRLHIGFFGRRNAGKSTLLNALARQQVSIVSATPGTTTDPVHKAMELQPLGPVVRHGDNNWGDIVMWTVNCTIEAEQLGITSANVDEFLGSDDPYVLNVLGVEGDLGQAMGLNNDWCYQVIKQVGNYGEIYDKNLGPDTRFNVPRGLNTLYTEGGLLYSPPFRG